MFHLLFLFSIYNRFPEQILKNFPLSTGESGKLKSHRIKVYIMRMSHEIFNMEWSNRDSIYLHTRDGVLYSAFAGSAERLLSLVGGLRPCRSFWCGQEFPAVHSIRARKILEFFPGSCIFINDYYIRITLACPLIK